MFVGKQDNDDRLKKGNDDKLHNNGKVMMVGKQDKQGNDGKLDNDGKKGRS